MSEDRKIGLDPFGQALADHIGGGNAPDFVEDLVDAELDSLLFDDSGDGVTVTEDGVIVGAEGVIGIDPTAILEK